MSRDDSDAQGTMRPEDLAARLHEGEELVLLDVREEEELAICALPGVVHIPLGELSVRHTELDPDDEIVCICHHGIRSASAAMALYGLGFESIWNLSGGMERWARDVDPTMRRY